MIKGFIVFLGGFLLFISSSLLQADSRFYGIGCVLTHKHNSTLITDVLSGSPAQMAGLHSGDYILAVDNTLTAKLPLTQVVNMIRGPEGTLVSITAGDLQGHSRNLTMKRVAIVTPTCFMEGSVQLTFVNGGGVSRPFGVSGYIGNEFVNWSISGNIIRAPYHGEYLTLMLISNGTLNTIEGAIHGYLINWTGSNMINTYQTCIP